jgi:hypothetical protein
MLMRAGSSSPRPHCWLPSSRVYNTAAFIGDGRWRSIDGSASGIPRTDPITDVGSVHCETLPWPVRLYLALYQMTDAGLALFQGLEDPEELDLSDSRAGRFPGMTRNRCNRLPPTLTHAIRSP